MPLIIACLSQKGGVGKSTLARLIARTYAAGGWSVKIADFNTTQLSSFNWTQIRNNEGHKPKIDSEPAVSPSLLKRENYDLVVADGRPDSDQSSLEIARIADLVVIPTGLPLDDLMPQLRFANELVEKDVEPQKILWVLNKITDSVAAVAEARDYIRQDQDYRIAAQELMHKISYQKAQNHGLALSEVGRKVGSLEEKADLLAAEIVNLVTELTKDK